MLSFNSAIHSSTSLKHRTEPSTLASKGELRQFFMNNFPMYSSWGCKLEFLSGKACFANTIQLSSFVKDLTVNAGVPMSRFYNNFNWTQFSREDSLILNFYVPRLVLVISQFFRDNLVQQILKIVTNFIELVKPNFHFFVHICFRLSIAKNPTKTLQINLIPFSHFSFSFSLRKKSETFGEETMSSSGFKKPEENDSLTPDMFS
ncbi:hypothetical protein Q3G72_030933 [Acer saccharum]|nr:hypothetical protein Q3G72_030933 [Acer saccharum]